MVGQPNMIQLLANPYASAAQKQALLDYQQKAGLAQALQAEGLKPIDLNNRMMGQIAYKISPLEPLAKIAQALAGSYGLKSANDELTNSFNPQPQPSDASSGDQMPDAAPPQNLPSDQMGGFSPDNVKAIAAQLATTQQPQQMQLSPELQAIGLRNPEILDKVIAENALGDHRAGSQRYNMQTGRMEFVPTDTVQNMMNPQYGSMFQQEQYNKANPARVALGNAAAANVAAAAPLGQQQALMNGGMPAPQQPQAAPAPMPAPSIQPVQTQALPPLPTPSAFSPNNSGTVSPTATDLTDALDSKGISLPASGLSDNAPLPAAAPASNVAPSKQVPLQDLNAMTPEGAKKFTQDQGANQAENLQQYIAASSNAKTVLDRINEMHQANKDSSYSVLNNEDGSGPTTFVDKANGNTASQANAKLHQIREQGLISQIASQLQGSNLKPNRALEGIISGADSFKLNQGKPATATSIDGLGENYFNNLVSQYDKAQKSGLNPEPLQPIMMRTPKGIGYVDPRHVSDVIRKGGTFDISDNPIVVSKKANQ